MLSILGALIFGLLTPHTSGSMLTVKLNKIPNNKGKLLIGVYNKEEGFRDMEKTFRNLTVNAKEGEMTVYIDNLPPGKYAIAVFHDKNENGKLDKNFLGIPKEKYGFSNDAMGKMGPPSYEACTVEVNGDKTISIKMK